MARRAHYTGGMKIALLTATLAACAAPAPRAPRVLVLGDGGPVLPEYVLGAQAWNAIGFDVSADDEGLPECESTWWQTGAIECQISIGVRRDPLLREKMGTNAEADQMLRLVTIDSEVTDEFALMIASAHEFGHLLLQTGRHTTTGVMAGETYVLTAADRDLACSAIDLCGDAE